MLKKYYLQQLQNLKDLAFEFSKTHPAIAPLLSGPSNDPDVERLLEGVAFLNGLIAQKLDDEFPEIIHGLLNVVFPHYLRPLPCCSIITLTPKSNLKEILHIPAGASIATPPVEGTVCLFRTCFDTEVSPLRLTNTEMIRQAGQRDRLHLSFTLSGMKLSQWQPQRLRFFLGENFAQGTSLFLLLTKYVRKISLLPRAGGSPGELSPHDIRPLGFELRNSLFPYPTQAFHGFRILQEYFLFPQKFLFLDLEGWDKWHHRGEGSEFNLECELEPLPFSLPPLTPRQFTLFATPVVNLFPHEAEPILFDHRSEKVLIQAGGTHKEHYQVFSIDKVTGFEKGSLAKKNYLPLELFPSGETNQSVYQVTHARSAIDDSIETYLSIPYTPLAPNPTPEILTVALTCTNGRLPEQLRLGDLCKHTVDLPELVLPANIMAPTAAVDPPIGQRTLWTYLSHLSLNFLQIAEAEACKSLLRLYAFPDSRDRIKVTANLKRIEGISKLEVSSLDRLHQGTLIRGFKLTLTLRIDHFANLADLHLFASVLDLFFGIYSSINSFVQLEVKESITGETFVWSPRMGDKQLT